MTADHTTHVPVAEPETVEVEERSRTPKTRAGTIAVFRSLGRTRSVAAARADVRAFYNRG